MSDDGEEHKALVQFNPWEVVIVKTHVYTKAAGFAGIKVMMVQEKRLSRKKKFSGKLILRSLLTVAANCKFALQLYAVKCSLNSFYSEKHFLKHLIHIG